MTWYKLLVDFSFPDIIPEPIHKTLLNHLKLFLIIGGMPAAVKQFVKGDNIQEAIREQAIILQTYEDDFTKYRKRIYPQRLKKVFRRIPALVGGKLKYVHIDPEDRSRELAKTLDLLELAQVLYRVKHSNGNGVPLGAEVKERDFKPLFLDTGLMANALGLTLTSMEMASNLLQVNRGAVAEQFIGQHLLYDRHGYKRPRLYYWNREKRNLSAEVDYLISLNDQVIPVEVKAGTTGSLKSLQLFIAEKNQDWRSGLTQCSHVARYRQLMCREMRAGRTHCFRCPCILFARDNDFLKRHIAQQGIKKKLKEWQAKKKPLNLNG